MALACHALHRVVLTWELGALYLYRHSRRQALVNDSSDDHGVRLSIPLNRIHRFEEAHCLTFTYLLTVHVPFALYDAPISSQAEETNKIQFITLQPTEAWNNLRQYIDVAKGRQQPGTMWNPIIDFGPLSFLEDEDMGESVDIEKDKESAIRRALGLWNESTLWGAFLSCCTIMGLV
jgi:sterol 3beta-glucosyltransferase